MSIKRGIDKAVATIVEELKNMAKPVKGSNEVAQVGSISANNDPEIGQMLLMLWKKLVAKV
jgi:chaperonin GroEL